jgi:hypothetical protein
MVARSERAAIVQPSRKTGLLLEPHQGSRISGAGLLRQLPRHPALRAACRRDRRARREVRNLHRIDAVARADFGRTDARQFTRSDEVKDGGAIRGELKRVTVPLAMRTVPPRFSSAFAAEARKSSASKLGAFVF